MTFPNTYKGIKKLVKAEILALVSEVMAIVMSILSLIIYNRDISLTDISSGLVISMYVLTLLFMIIRVCCYIINATAMRRANKDDANFKIAFYSIIITLILSAGSIVFAFNKEVESIGELLIILTAMLGEIYILEGIRSLSKKLGHPEMDKIGAVFYAIIVTIFIIRTCMSILILIFDVETATEQSAILGIIDSVMSMTESAILLFYFAKAIKIFSKE